MTFRDATDEEIATEVLKRLRAKGLRSVRQMEKACPANRTTLAAWRNGRYGMKGPTREACIEWLGEAPVAAAPLTESDEKRIAAKWMERTAERLRAEATESPAAGDTGSVPMKKARAMTRRPGRRKRGSGEP
jgi:hypothetical protein